MSFGKLYGLTVSPHRSLRDLHSFAAKAHGLTHFANFSFPFLLL
jgi:glutathione S-transferase-like protein